MPMPNPLPPPSWREPPPPPPNEKPPLRPPPPECPPEKPPEERPPPEKPPDERPPPEKPPPLLPPPDLPMALLHARKPAKPAPRTRKACELKGSQEHMLARRRSNSLDAPIVSVRIAPRPSRKGKHNFEALTTLGVLPAIIRNRRGRVTTPAAEAPPTRQASLPFTPLSRRLPGWRSRPRRRRRHWPVPGSAPDEAGVARPSTPRRVRRVDRPTGASGSTTVRSAVLPGAMRHGARGAGCVVGAHGS